jgi:hypothetical protein
MSTVRNKHRARYETRDFREGIRGGPTGWLTPEKLHATCKWRMEQFDRLPKDVKDFIREHGYA